MTYGKKSQLVARGDKREREEREIARRRDARVCANDGDDMETFRQKNELTRAPSRSTGTLDFQRGHLGQRGEEIFKTKWILGKVVRCRRPSL